MSEIVVGVTGLHSSDNPGPGVGVARSLKEASDLNVRVVGLAYDAMETGLYLNQWVDHAFIIPYPSSGGNALLERLRYIKAAVGLDVVTPTLDVELPLYAKLEQTLAEEGIRTFLPTAEQFRLRGKDRLVDVASAIGLHLPRTAVVSSIADVQDALKEFSFPVMVKGVFYKAYRAYSATEAVGHALALAVEWGYPILLQEIISGEELNVIALGDGQGGCLGLVGMKKIWTTPLGKIWTGVTIRNEVMEAAAQKFIETYCWRGAFELECIVDGNKVYLIEINPRFPSWCYFATAVGVNLPANLVRTALGRPAVSSQHFDAGRLYIRSIDERIIDMSIFQKMVTKGET
ncbi:ATP-grasp domain-containing protein [Azospirillaceae bacterium]